MIKIRKKAAAAIPSILKTKARQQIKTLKSRYDKGETNFSGKDLKAVYMVAKELRMLLSPYKITNAVFANLK